MAPSHAYGTLVEPEVDVAVARWAPLVIRGGEGCVARRSQGNSSRALPFSNTAGPPGLRLRQQLGAGWTTEMVGTNTRVRPRARGRSSRTSQERNQVCRQGSVGTSDALRAGLGHETRGTQASQTGSNLGCTLVRSSTIEALNHYKSPLALPRGAPRRRRSAICVPMARKCLTDLNQFAPPATSSQMNQDKS